jgi:hypothetical protein
VPEKDSKNPVKRFFESLVFVVQYCEVLISLLDKREWSGKYPTVYDTCLEKSFLVCLPVERRLRMYNLDLTGQLRPQEIVAAPGSAPESKPGSKSSAQFGRRLVIFRRIVA